MGAANTITYNKVIKAYSCSKQAQCNKASSPADAERLVAIMKEKNIARSSITYTSLITAYANAQFVEPEKGEAAIQSMIDEGLSPSTITYTSLLKAYAQSVPIRCGDALKLLNEMKNRGVQPNVISYNIVIGAFASPIEADPETCEEL